MASVYVQRPFETLPPADWDAVVNVDLRAAFLCARAAVPHMRKQGGGRIITFSDWVAASGRPRYKGFLRVLRGEGRRHRAGRGARAGARGRQHSRERDRARPDRRAAGHD